MPIQALLMRNAAVAPAPVATTYPVKANVKLYVYGKGTDGTTLVADHSNSINPLTTVGNAQVDTGIPIDGPALLFDGTGDYFTMPQSTAFNVGSATDFCVEAKIQRAAVSGGGVIFSTRGLSNDGGFWFYVDTATGLLNLQTIGTLSSSAGIVTSSSPLSASTTYHVAGSREGTTLRLFIDGVLAGTATQSGTPVNPSGLKSIGYNVQTASGDFKGSINHLRFTNGEALYTATFIPPTPPLLHTLGAFPDVTMDPNNKDSSITLADGHLVMNGTVIAYRSARATKSIAHTAKGSFEVLCNLGAFPLDEMVIGVGTSSAVLNNFVGSNSSGWGVYQKNGQKFTNGSGSAFGSSWTAGDVITCEFDNGSLWFKKNNVYMNSGSPAFTGITGTIYPIVTMGQNNTRAGARFALDYMTYTPTTGIPAWETA